MPNVSIRGLERVVDAARQMIDLVNEIRPFGATPQESKELIADLKAARCNLDFGINSLEAFDEEFNR